MPRNDPGLTLLETMIAVLILGVGMASVLSLFPVAGSVQRHTYDEVVVRQFSDSVSDLIHARGFSIVDLIDPLKPMDLLSFEVRPVPAKVLDATSPTLTLIRWGLPDRCYPSAMGGDPDGTGRAYYWVPMVRRANLLDWQIFVFILKRDEGASFIHNSSTANPKDPPQVPAIRSVKVEALSVANSLVGTINGVSNSSVTLGSETNQLILKNNTDVFEPGDLVLDSQGVVHRVTDVNGNTLTLDGFASPLVTALWYAPRPSPYSQSPTRRILTFGNGVVLK